jgi:excisionase family DNA binding protein
MKELLTAREVQDLLKVDRVTVYRMLKDGRLSGVKVGQQWRFEQASVDRLLSGEQPEQRTPSRPADVLPLHCIQPIQDVFAEVAGVSAVTVAPGGEPLTTPSGSCRFCALIQSSPSGMRACQESWRQLSDAEPGAFATCHAGLNYAHGTISVDGELVALIIAGQFHAEPPNPAAAQSQIARLAAAHGLGDEALAEAAAAIPILDARAHEQLAGWLRRVAGTFETIAHERAALLCRLRRIAEMTVLDA